ncbi:FeoA family protein [Cutibacterium porci]
MNRSIASNSFVVPLSSLPAGHSATIEDISADCADHICHRLHMLGFGRGREITKIRQAPFGGPMVFHVCDVHMCLRRAQADMIMVRPTPQPQPTALSRVTAAAA